jgi:hydrogenase expression/formation protein HypC
MRLRRGYNDLPPKEFLLPCVLPYRCKSPRSTGFLARCEARGTFRDVSVFMIRDELPQVGDHVMVSAGQAVRKVSEEDARLSWELYDQILAETPEPPPQGDL